jgi:hypothetical protein
MSRGSLRLDARELDYLGPFLGFVRDERTESARTRAWSLQICWGDGAPFHHHWPLEMPAGPTAVGEPEPQLPSVDPPTVKPFDFEADVERLIEKTLAERSEREEKAKPESKARPRRKKY